MACEVNKTLLPLKLFFGFYLAGLACIIPYMPVFARQLGFTDGELAVIYGLLPFVGLLSKPVVGIIADKLNAHRLVLLIALIVQGVFTFIVYFLPEQPGLVLLPTETAVHLTCNQQAATLDLRNEARADTVFCLGKNVTTVRCKFGDANGYANEALNVTASNKPLHFTLHAVAAVNSTPGTCPAYVCDSSVPVRIDYDGVSRATCTKSLTSNCSAFLCKKPEQERNFVRFTYQFWLFLIVMTIGRAGFTSVYTMGDSVTFDLISQQKKPVSYGAQRVFGTLGWAAAAVVVGLLMDAFTEREQPLTDFAPAFYGFVVLIFLAMVTAWFLRPSENIQSTQVLKNVANLFRDMEFLIFSVGTFLVGTCMGLLYTYLFVYIKYSLNSPQLLMGLSAVFDCFGEAPFMFLSSWFISRIGHHGTMTMALAAFCVRFMGYSLLGAQPWWILILELLHGPCFGLFYANMATFANNVAPAGGAATMQGVLGGIYDGFGIAVGGLVGGAIYDRYGAEIAWRTFGIGAGIAAILYCSVTEGLKRHQRRDMKDAFNPSAVSLQNTSILNGTTSGYETPIPPDDTPSEKERLTA
ncbi:hypothetical protein BV898_14523 [Hypsibius exemplaris]|uniref:Major facilitator superfamily (MFS) profile domain-containing protein n=1 Tax=Hypsibius exemplaris TaxID=2072580 RepID=A0A9X6N938_HYPEX|nr:hypothetical protein BV898_14523 [Hypsibius exemplaris]